MIVERDAGVRHRLAAALEAPAPDSAIIAPSSAEVPAEPSAEPTTP